MKRYNKGGLIDYRSVQDDPSLLDAYLEDVGSVTVEELNTFTREQTMAFWVNVYHASLIKAVIQHYPLSTIGTIPNFWTAPIIRIADEDLNLDDIRRKKLVDRFKDERLDCALSYAALGGPRLCQEAYTGSLIDEQLHEDALKFVNDDIKNLIDPEAKRVMISMVFQWNASDFIMNFGTIESFKNLSAGEMAVLGFISYYLEDKSKHDFLEGEDYKLQYMVFDWRLNDLVLEKEAPSLKEVANS